MREAKDSREELMSDWCKATLHELLGRLGERIRQGLNHSLYSLFSCNLLRWRLLHRINRDQTSLAKKISFCPVFDGTRDSFK